MSIFSIVYDAAFLSPRYFTQDNWNILDTLSITSILVAFIFRMLALWLNADENTLVTRSRFLLVIVPDFSEQASSEIAFPPVVHIATPQARASVVTTQAFPT